MATPPRKRGVLRGGVRVWIFSSIFVQSWWFKMKIYSTMINEFISHTVLHVRAPSRAPKIDEIEVSLKNVNFRPFSRHVYLIVQVTFTVSAYNGQFMNEIFIVWNTFMLVSRNLCARSGARNISTKSIYFLWRDFYTIVTTINHSIAKIRTKHMFIQRLIHVKHHSKKYYISKM